MAKRVSHHVRRRGGFALCLAVLALASGGCGEDCSTVDVVSKTYIHAMVYPEDLNEYVRANGAMFNDDFYGCIEAKRRKIHTILAELERQCDETFIEGSDFWHQCYDAAAQDGSAGVLGGLDAILRTVRDGTPFAQTTVGYFLMVLKFSYSQDLFPTPADYEEYMLQLTGLMGSSLDCEKCEKRKYIFWKDPPEYE